MATGDIIGVEIDDGIHSSLGSMCRITIEGCAGATAVSMANGFGSNNSPTGAKFYGTITSKSIVGSTGADTTVARTYYATSLKPKQYPDQATTKFADNGSDLDVWVVLSTRAHVKDNTGGGNSGTAPTWTALAGFLTATVGGSPIATNAGSGTVTNSSQLTYAVPLGRWFWTDEHAPRRFVGSTFKLGVLADCIYGVNGVKFTCTGVTSAVVVTSYVTSQTAHTGENGKVVCIYEATIDGSGFTQGEQVNIDFQVLPTVGDDPYDSSEHTSDDVAWQHHTEQVTCNKTGAATVYAAVDGVGGGTPATSATEAGARLTPYADIEDALDAVATTTTELIVVLEAATHAGFGGTLSAIANVGWRTIRPADGVSRASAIIQFQTASIDHNQTRLCLRGVTIKGSDTTAGISMFSGDSTRYLWCDGCSFVKGSQANTWPCGYLHILTTLTECVFDDISYWDPGSETGRAAYQMGFCDFTNLGASYSAAAVYSCWGNEMVAGDCFVMTESTVTASNPAQSNFFMVNSAFYQVDNNNAQLLKLAVNRAVVGIVLVGSIIEKQNTSTAGSLSIAADGSWVACDHVLLRHMTVVGARFNFSYNHLSVVDPTTPGADHLSRKWWEIIGCALPSTGADVHQYQGTGTVTAVDDSGGFARFATSTSWVSSLAPQSASFPGQWFKITGTAGYDGWHKATAVTATHVTSATAYGASEGSLSATLDVNSGTRYGGIENVHSVDRRHCHMEITSVLSQFDGMDATVADPMPVVDDESTTGGNTGYGDYTPTYGGDLMGRLTVRRLAYDMNGTLIRTGGLGDVGAIQHGYITLTAPADLATDQPTTLTFSWEAYALAGHYHLFYTPDGGVEVEVADIEGTSHQVTGLDPSTLYTWYVIAHPIDDTHAAIASSETWEFTTAAAAADGHSRTGLTLGLGLGL